MTWDLSPGSYDRQLPEHLADLARARARSGTRPPRRSLDTGPPEGWDPGVPEWVLDEIVDDLESARRGCDDHDDPMQWGMPA
ncbi:hypothetical protein [Knoellia flava]|uniref:Uncharacterized protein n=1 Tax=Knoellia flava TaxID=913969 RepID=A0A8H9FW12_9MICO|nr:hypothetical protein [Knoellia flava]GGB88558.1 hypothetical protein GCM10011314_30440 [Knoellia flava]